MKDEPKQEPITPEAAQAALEQDRIARTNVALAEIEAVCKKFHVQILPRVIIVGEAIKSELVIVPE